MVPHLDLEPHYGSSSSRLHSPSTPSRPEHLKKRTQCEVAPDCPVAQNSMLSCRRGSGEPDLASSQGRQSEPSFSLPADTCIEASRMISGLCGGTLVCRTPRDRPRRAVSALAEMPFVMFSLQLQNGNNLLAQHGLWRVYAAARYSGII